MANLQVKDLPGDLHRRLRRVAAARGTTIRDLVIEAVRRELSREEFRLQLAARRPVTLGRPAARSLQEERDGRERALGR